MLDSILSAAPDGESVVAPVFVAGEWIDKGAAVDRVGPYVRRVVSRAVAVDADQIHVAVRYARHAGRTVARFSPAARAEVLERAAGIAVDRRSDVARLIALELGKPLKDGLGEMDRVADTLAICAAEARQIGGDMLPVAGWARGVGNTAMTFRAPAGVALAITPFNAPANLLAHKLGASFAAGNTTVVKSPPQAPAATAAVVAMLLEAGAAAESVQLLHGGGDLGAQLCAADEISVISFTGSAATGAAVARAAGAKRLVLELGGNAATIVCEDADIASAAANCARTGYSNSGQSCISVQRLYVQRSVFNEFLDGLTAEVAKLRVGDPLDGGTDVGSMVDDAAARRVVGWTADAVAGGATVALGGERDGATLMPTVVVNPPPDAAVIRHEVFGALVAVTAFDDFDAVLDVCNSQPFRTPGGSVHPRHRPHSDRLA